MLTVFLERKQSMGMVIELAVISRNYITVERHQFQHPLNLLCLETATCRDEHLQFCTATPTDAGKNGRRNGLFAANLQEIADDLITSIHPDIIRFTYLLVFYTLVFNENC